MTATLCCLAAMLSSCGTSETKSGTAKQGDSGSNAVDVAAVDTGVAQPDVHSEPDLGPPNKPPIATDDLVTNTGATSVPITVLQNDIDPDGDKLTIHETTQGKQGVVAIKFGGTELEYTLVDPGFVGIDTFQYTVTDGKGGSDTANVTVLSKGAPKLTITQPADGAVLKGSSVTVKFEVTGCNFTYPSNDKDGCHAHRYLDNSVYAPPGAKGPGQYVLAPIEVTPISAGKHTFLLVLTKNDGSDAPWAPSITDQVDFEIE